MSLACPLGYLYVVLRLYDGYPFPLTTPPLHSLLRPCHPTALDPHRRPTWVVRLTIEVNFILTFTRHLFPTADLSLVLSLTRDLELLVQSSHRENMLVLYSPWVPLVDISSYMKLLLWAIPMVVLSRSRACYLPTLSVISYMTHTSVLRWSPTLGELYRWSVILPSAWKELVTNRLMIHGPLVTVE